jgi:hypothetical protein
MRAAVVIALLLPFMYGCSDPTMGSQFDVGGGFVYYSYRGHIRSAPLDAPASWHEIATGVYPCYLEGEDALAYELDGQLHSRGIPNGTERTLASQGNTHTDYMPCYCQALRRVFFVRGEGSRAYAFGGRTPRSYDIFSCALTGDNIKRETFGEFHTLNLSPGSAAGRTVYYSALTLGTDPASIPPMKLYRLDVGTGRSTVVPSLDEVWEIAVDMRAGTLAYVSGKGNYTLCVSDLHGQGQRRLTSKPALLPAISFRHAPPGKIWILEDTTREDTFELGTLDVASGQRTTFMTYP